MKKRVLLIGGNFSPEQVGIGKYNGEMMAWLAGNGFDCTVITTAPYYPQWKVHKPYSGNWFKKELLEVEGGSIEVYRCPQYVPKNPNGKKRLLQDLSFSFSSFLSVLLALRKKKFDNVIIVAPPFHIGLHALLYKKIKGAKFFYHVQDLQIEAARDLNILKDGKLLSLLFKSEKYLLAKADVVSTVSLGMAGKIKEKINKEVVFFPNWVNTKSYFPVQVKEGLKENFGFAEKDKIILYSGAVGEKQGLEVILSIANSLKDRKEIKFIISGSGPFHQKLKDSAADIGIPNILFLPLQPAEVFNQFLNAADIHLVLQKKNASDLMMPSKLTTILAVGGLALVTAPEGSSLYTIIKNNNIGLVAEPENEDALRDVILSALETDHRCIKQNARRYAEEELGMDKVLGRYAERFV